MSFLKHTLYLITVFLFIRDRQDRPDPKDFTIADLKGETSGRLPGKVNGQQFIIRDCQVRLSRYY